LILERDDGFNGFCVYFLIKLVHDEDQYDYPSDIQSWWVHNFGSLHYKTGWNKYLVSRIGISKTKSLKLSVESLSEEKQEAYHEFVKQYLEKDLV